MPCLAAQLQVPRELKRLLTGIRAYRLVRSLQASLRRLRSRWCYHWLYLNRIDVSIDIENFVPGTLLSGELVDNGRRRCSDGDTGPQRNHTCPSIEEGAGSG